MAWLDRYNLGFAKLQMLKDLGFSEAVYGFGAGIVCFGYMLFEIPSNLLLERIGARKTFARITILWGITSSAMMFVKTATWFYILRFLQPEREQHLYSKLNSMATGENSTWISGRTFRSSFNCDWAGQS
jgi:MFS family permease